MNVFHDDAPKKRLIAMLLLLLENPYRYTRKQLANKYGVSTDTIKKDMGHIECGGFTIKPDEKHRYAIVPNHSAEKLEEALFFTEAEKDILIDALQQTTLPYARKEKIRQKLDAVYDVSKLGSSLFSKSFLDKVQLLEHAKKQKVAVRLINYRSTNSSEVTDRNVEAFEVSTKENILHCYDLDRQIIRHFRISRIDRVVLLPQPWQNEGKHYIIATDPFCIVNNHQVYVHIKLRVGGYNELTERFPLTKAYIKPDASQPNLFDFECKVNAKFLGITNFILGYHDHIEAIIEPENLISHLKNHANQINF